MKPIIFSAFLLLTTQAFADAAADVPADPKLNGYPPYAKVVLRSILDEYPPYSDLIVQFGVLYNVADDPGFFLSLSLPPPARPPAGIMR